MAAAAGCRSAHAADQPAIVQPGAPGQPTRSISAEQAIDLPRVEHTEADVRFMQNMIAHHAQAIEMTALLPARTSSGQMKLLAQRIDVSQADEIRMMQEWLERRGQAVPETHGEHQHHAGLMPGMLSAAEMERLKAANGNAFDALFLELMIKHHEGALAMVKDLFATPGAGQEPEIFAFASDVDADQRMEIARMAAMWKELQQ